jgi:uncharacterized membrane protein YccC
MIGAPSSSRLRGLVEHSVLTTDVARALRSSLAFAGVWIICLLNGQAIAAVFAAMVAMNLALVDVRGDYLVRLAILLTMTVVLAVSVFVGTISGANVASATLMMGALALLGGCWRHWSGDYGPNLAVISALLFLIALAQPGNWHAGLRLMMLVGFGGLCGITLQLSGWLFRPQHPLRHAVAETWVAAADLITSLRTETNEGEPFTGEFVEKESALRATVDRTLGALAAAASKRQPALLEHLDRVTHIAARLVTRVTALNTVLEAIRSRPEFTQVAPTLDLALRALANAARSAALTIITHRREQFVALEVRLQRCEHLLSILDERLLSLPSTGADVVQAKEILSQIAELLPVIRSTLAETVDQGLPRAGFALRLPELGGLSLRSLSSWVNPAQELDSVLVRYTLRVAVLMMVAVAIYKWFAIPRGYWIAFTAIVVLQPDYGATREKAGQRILGTLAGSVLGSALLWIKLPVAALVGLATIMAFGFAYFLKRRYALAVFFVTLMLVLMMEAVMPVNLDFTEGRLLSNVAGGAMALCAALFFWPKWEREQFPKIIATAVQANRNYLDAIGRQLISGEPFAGEAVQMKRKAERANSQASASIQRLLGEPSRRQNNTERAAALTAYNQRITRTLTVLGLHLNRLERVTEPAFTGTIQKINVALEALARGFETEQWPAARSETKIALPANRSAGMDLIYGQLAKVVTEIEAMTLAAQIQATDKSDLMPAPGRCET